MPTGLSRSLAGALAVAALKGLRALPPSASRSALAPLLPLYPRLRRAQARRLASLFAASPFADRMTLAGYYRARLDILLRSLALHGRPLARARIRIEGEDHYRHALSSGRPVALIGLHMGAVELLHRLPEAPAGRSFRILTATAFADPLTDFLREGRERDGKAVLQNRDLVPGLREVAAEAGVLACMADQVREPGAWLTLWGRIDIPWPERLLSFLRGREFALVPVSTWVAGDGALEYRYHAPWDPAAPAEDSLRAFLEESIARAPEQWDWSYPKVRLAAAGKTGGRPLRTVPLMSQ